MLEGKQMEKGDSSCVHHFREGPLRSGRKAFSKGVLLMTLRSCLNKQDIQSYRSQAVLADLL